MEADMGKAEKRGQGIKGSRDQNEIQNPKSKIQNSKKSSSVLGSFSYAFQGLFYCLSTQRHMRFHFIAGIGVLLGGVFLGLSYVELLLVFATICFVFITEMLNTAFEAIMDLTHSAHHPLAKVVKDVAAGCVLVASIFAVLVAALIYLPKIVQVIR